MDEKTDKNSLWPAFLPEVEQAINAALQTVAAQEECIATLSASEDAGRSSQLDSIRDRILGLETCVARPEQASAEVDAVLQSSEAEVRNYLEEVEAVQQRLAEWAARAVQ